MKIGPFWSREVEKPKKTKKKWPFCFFETEQNEFFKKKINLYKPLKRCRLGLVSIALKQHRFKHMTRARPDPGEDPRVSGKWAICADSPFAFSVFSNSLHFHIFLFLT